MSTHKLLVCFSVLQMATDKPGITEAETQPQLIIVYFRHCSSAAVDILQFSSCIKIVTAQEVIRRQESAFRVTLVPPPPPPTPSSQGRDRQPNRERHTDNRTERDSQAPCHPLHQATTSCPHLKELGMSSYLV